MINLVSVAAANWLEMAQVHSVGQAVNNSKGGRRMPFRNRAEAGRRLAMALSSFRGQAVVVLALPRGGVPVAAEVAEALDAPLDLVLVRKIGAPGREELAMGAVADAGAPITVRNADVIAMLGIDEAIFDAARRRQLVEIERRRAAYLGEVRPLDLHGRVAIVVDDGVATGATTRAALRAVRALKPSQLVLAVPVAASDSLIELNDEADAVVCLEDYPNFGAIGFYYADFNQVSDEEVIEILTRFRPT
jgi:putative phosphoribosyl transferase